ncbi:UNVERIFIED_CONTAM: Gag-Pol polyprotein [Sesamum radiatum]|uniref:Gag-Pol polyprotein n=1 Tax=Sesamum radiatum TaxID=300843 RepID=A0AAW2KAU6_SESRA
MRPDSNHPWPHDRENLDAFGFGHVDLSTHLTNPPKLANCKVFLEVVGFGSDQLAPSVGNLEKRSWVEMEGDTPRREEDPSRQTEQVIQLTRSELRRLMEEAGQNAIVQHERRTVTPLTRAPKRRLFEEREGEREQLEEDSREEPEKGQEGSEVGSSEKERGKRRESGISKAEVDDVGRQIERLGKQINELKRRGELVSQNRHSPFSNKILTEVVDPNFRMPDLPKYDGTKDPQEHVAAFELVMNLYGQSSAINAKLFVTTLTGKAQEWFTSLPSGGIETFDQLIQKFTFHFASKRKQKRSATYLFNIRQGENESLKNFIGRFNNETLEVQDLRIDMIVSILIHGLKKGLLASALARDPPEDEQLMKIAQKCIDEEEINAMKDGEWQRSRDRGRWKDNKEKYVRTEKGRESPYRPRFHRERGHDTEDCYQLKDEIERLVRQGYFREFILEQGGGTRDHRVGRKARSKSRSRERFKGDGGRERRENVLVKGVINTIAGGSTERWSNRERKRYERSGRGDRRKELVLNVEQEEEITFGAKDREGSGSQDDPMVIKLDIANFSVHKVLIDNGSLADIVFWDVIKRMGLESAQLQPVHTPLVGFGGSEVASMGTITLPVSMGEEPKRKTLMIKFLVVDTPFTYNVILGQPGLNAFKAVVSTYHQKMKFSTKNGVGEVICDRKKARRCYNLSLKKGEPNEKLKRKEREDMEESEPKKFKPERIEPVEEFKTVRLIAHVPEKVTRIGSKMSKAVETMMVEFLKENVDMFAWKKAIFWVERNRVIEEEVKKLLEAGYVSEVQYTEWLANVVVVPKASGKWRMCTDFTDLNKGYHQIFMAEEDRVKTSFITDQGIYCYNVMPFGLKNAGATYQRLVNRMFKNQIRSTMEVYVDDMLVKSKEEDHLRELKRAFDIMRDYGMKLNPEKCTFGVRGGKFLGYMVSEKGIEANPEKIQAIIGLRSPRTLNEMQKLTGKITSLSRFISRSADRSLLFFKALGKAKEFKWTEECEQALNELKKYLATPPLLANPKLGEVLFLYLAVSESAVSSVLVREQEKSQSPVYYVSRMLQGAEKRYTQIEKLALALVVTARKLRPYFQSHKVIVLTNHPLRHIMTKPDASGRLVKWAVELGEYDIEYQGRTSIKAQALAYFIVEFTGEQIQEEKKGWLLHVDGLSNANNGGAGILLQGPDGVEIEVAARLSFPTTNNEAEYEAMVLGLQLAMEARVKEVNVCTDSQLVAMQVEGSYETREQTMVQYLKKVKELMARFDKCVIQQIPRTENERADVLSKFEALIAGVKERKIALMIKEKEELQVIENSGSWKVEFMNYLKEGILPDDPIKAKRLKFKATRFTIIGDDLYKRTVDGPLLKCLDEERAQYVLQEIHEGSCGNHAGGRSLAQKIKRQGYFWPTLVKDAVEFARKCESCQRYASLIHTPATPMEPIRIACPFNQWGIDILGPFPQAVAQKKFIVVAVEYFSKWVEAEALAKITEREMINFIWKNIICRFGIPRVLISDNGTQFQGKAITAWCKELKIQQNFTAVGNPQENGQTEVTNRTILQHLKTRLEGAKGSWVEELPGVLWAYRTTPRSATGETPFCLVFGTEAIIPAEIGEETQRVAQYEREKNQEERAFDLTMIEERRDAAYAKILHHKGLMMRNYNRKNQAEVFSSR